MKSFLIQDILADQPGDNSSSSSSASSEAEDSGGKSPEKASAAAGKLEKQHQTHQHQHQQQQDQQDQQQQSAQFQFSPLDALFRMASSAFTQARAEKRKDRETDHHGSTNFTSKQTSKKKRKSRTAFTNNQIYELERRFSLQKYLSPTDRDEIANTLNLSNAQVITWFQNRRAKLKRDLEEQKRDIATATMLSTVTMQQKFLESLRALTQIENAIRTPDDMSQNGYVESS